MPALLEVEEGRPPARLPTDVGRDLPELSCQKFPRKTRLAEVGPGHLPGGSGKHPAFVVISCLGRNGPAGLRRGRSMKRMFLGFLGLMMLTTPILAAGRPMTIDDLLAVKAVSDPQVSPDGRWVAYVVSELDRATDKTNSDLWLVPLTGG